MKHGGSAKQFEKGKCILKDRVLLLITAVVVSIVVYFFWKYAGEKGFMILLIISFIGMMLEYIRLRRKIKKNCINRENIAEQIASGRSQG